MNSATRSSNALGDSFQNLLERARSLPMPVLLGGGALLIAMVVALAMWSRGPDYQVLFTNVNDRDGGAIISSLTQMNVPYRFEGGGSIIAVPADRVHQTRLALASQGLPRGGNVGFELLDNSQFGASQFTEQINYQRALEGELARSIESVQSVESARVHLAIPRQSLFVRDRQPPTASILVHLFPGRTLDPAQVSAIAHLVSSSVADLSPANVSIVDQYGRLLSNTESNAQGMDASQLRQVREIEQIYAQRIEAILTPLVGPGNARAQVTADLDFTRREETSEIYRPNQLPGQATVRSQQLSEVRQDGDELAQGIPGALSNQPPLDPVAPIIDPEAAIAAGVDGANAAAAELALVNMNNTLAQAGLERRESTTNYEVDRTITHLQHAVGSVKRLSVAVVVNYLPDAEGEMQPLPVDDLEQLRSLVQQAMGYSAQRGDSVNVVNQAFIGSQAPRMEWYEDSGWMRLGQTAINALLVLVVLFLIYFAIVRPMMRRRAAEVEVRARELEHQQVEAVREAEQVQRVRRQGRYDDNLETARNLSSQDPRAVAAVLRGWMEDRNG